MAETARGEATALRLRAEAEADATRLRAEAEALATRALGSARAQAYHDGSAALGAEAYTAMQVATVLAEHKAKLVPDVAVGGAANGGLAEAFMGRLLVGLRPNGS